MIYGYARCSTSETKQDVAGQKRELKEMGAEEIYFEYETGTKVDRPELKKMLSRVSEGDTILTTEVSRLTRSISQLCQIIDIVKEKRLKLVIGGLVVDCTGESMDIMVEAMLKMVGVFAELERNLICERIRRGLKNAKAKGVRLGRPALTADKLPKIVMDKFYLYKAGLLSVTELANMCGVSRPTMYKYIAILTDR
jgi:DNA invertase Pin-like site-specific DNA recombinase